LNRIDRGSIDHGGNRSLPCTGSRETTIGGTQPAFANIIGANGSSGIRVSRSDNTTIRGSFVGINRDDADVGNDGSGVRIDSGTQGAVVGGTADGAENVISGNGQSGIRITDVSGNGTASNTVEGNLIGTNTAGDATVGNDGNGVAIREGSSSNTIGGTTSEAANIVAGNRDEISIDGDNNTVQGNFVGTNSSNTDLGTSFNGVFVALGTTGNLIGGTASGAGNVIGYTATHSVYLRGSNHVVQGNFIGVSPGGTSLSASGSGIRIQGTGHQIGGTSVRTKQPVTVTVYNVLGQEVQTLYRGSPNGNESKSITLRSTDLASGAYFVRMRTAETTQTRRFTVVK